MHTIETIGPQLTPVRAARKTAPEAPEVSRFHRMLQQADGARPAEKPAPTEPLSIEQQLLAAMLQIQPDIPLVDNSGASMVTVAVEPLPTQQPMPTDGLPTMQPLPAKNPLGELTAETAKIAALPMQTTDFAARQTVPVETAVQTAVQTTEPTTTQTAPRQDTARPLPERLSTDVGTIAPQTRQLSERPLAPTAKSDGAEEQTTSQKQTIPQTTPLFHDVKAVPIKVGAVDTTAGAVDVQLARQLAPALRRGDSRVQIQLSPESLGTVTIEMTHSQDGSLHVVLSAGGERAQGILERASAGLQSLLTSHTQTLVQVEVQRQQESQPGNDQRGQQQQQQQQQQPQRDSRQHRQQTQDFIQRLRLGLSEAEAS
ncbi:MAG: flagellar hook-length control protein FliK [Oscillospiraceae bacterium]